MHTLSVYFVVWADSESNMHVPVLLCDLLIEERECCLS